MTITSRRQLLREWAAAHPRPLPWKGIDNPYFIWLSEIMLQQTRVEQGLPYYEKFIRLWPTITDLANASQDDLFKAWEGLGYYSRARNLHAAAQTVAEQYGGAFPGQYEQIRALKGVGDYTAAAIASFAFGLPYSVLDGNVFRVLARWYGIHTPLDTPEGRKQFSALAQELLDPAAPGAHNQAMMDFGATWCTPRQPKCADCPFQSNCMAYKNNLTAELPVKLKKTPKKERFFVYFVFKHKGRTYLRRRNDKDIWQHLYEFPGVETARLPIDTEEASGMGGLPRFAHARLSGIFRQTLTHRLVAAVFLLIETDEDVSEWTRDCVAVPWSPGQLPVAVPRIIDQFWKAR